MQDFFAFTANVNKKIRCSVNATRITILTEYFRCLNSTSRGGCLISKFSITVRLSDLHFKQTARVRIPLGHFAIVIFFEEGK